MKVLVIDDDSVTRRALASLLRRRGCEVLTASDGEQAHALLLKDESPPGLVIIDWDSSDSSGLNFCRKLRHSQQKRAHVIMLVSKTRGQHIASHSHDGVDEYVRKPFDVDELYARVRAAERRLSPSHCHQPRLSPAAHL